MRYKDFLFKANKVHDNKYIYNFSEEWWLKSYKNNKCIVSITCPEHGRFEQMVYNHLQGYIGCKECSLLNRPISNKIKHEEFINIIHGNKYNYSLITKDWWNNNYINVNTLIPIIFPIHGKFKQ